MKELTGARHFERDGYHVFDWPARRDLFISHLWERFPDLVIGRYLVNTSFDSGSLTLSESEAAAGWHKIGELTHSPKITEFEEIPHDQYDEWLVFEQAVDVQAFETLVNYGGFSPIDFSWEEKLELYWRQVLQLKPLHIIAENDAVYLVTRDASVVARVMKAADL